MTDASVTSGSNSFTFTYEQFENLMRNVIKDMKHDVITGDCTDDELKFVAGMICLNAATIDTRASDHMTPFCRDMINAKILESLPKITLPNGDSSEITQIGQVKLKNGILLKDIGGLYHLLNVLVDQADVKLRIEVESSVNSGLFSCSASVYNKAVYPNMYNLWHHRLGHIMKHVQSYVIPVVNDN
ncbi:hypothetical protein Tco_1560079 [Tanacetum coccineum]